MDGTVEDGTSVEDLESEQARAGKDLEVRSEMFPSSPTI